MLDPATIAALTSFFSGISQNCLVTALTEWKKQKDEKGELEKAKILSQVQESKTVEQRLKERITDAFRHIHLDEKQAQILLHIEQDSILKTEITQQIRSNRYSPSSLTEVLISSAPDLARDQASILHLSRQLLEAIRLAISSDAQLKAVLDLEFQSEASSTLETINRTTSATHEQISFVLPSVKQGQDDMMRILKQLAASPSFTPSFSTADQTDLLTIHKSQIQRRFDRARAELLRGSVIRAEELFRELVTDLEASGAIADQTLLFRSYTNLGASLWNQDRGSDAFPWFEKAYDLKPDDAKAKTNIALVLIQKKEFGHAEVLLKEASTAEPDNFEAVAHLVWMRLEQQENEKAIEILKQKQFNSEQYHILFGHAYTRLSDYESAVAEARKALAINPESAQAQAALSEYLGVPIIAEKAKRKNMESMLSEGEREALSEAAKSTELAVKNLRKQERKTQVGGLLINLSAYRLALGNPTKAVDAAREASSILPENLQALINLFAAQCSSGAFSDACVTADHAIRLDKSRSSYLMKVEASILARQPNDALQAYQESIERFPELARDPHVISLRSVALFRLPNIAAAFNCLNEAIESAPGESELYLQRGRLYELIDEPLKAQEDFEQAESLVTDENRLGILIRSGLYFFRRQKWAEAAIRFGQIDAAVFDSPVFTENLICLFNLQRYAVCLPLAKEALRREAFDETHYELAARCYILTGDLPDAVRLLKELVRRRGSSELMQSSMLADVYFRLDEIDKAYDVLKQAAARHPDDMLLLTNLSGLEILKGFHQESVRHAIKAVSIAPSEARAHWSLINAVLSLPQGDHLTEQNQKQFHESIGFLGGNFPSSGLRTIPVEGGVEIITEMLKEQYDKTKQVWDLVRERKLPMAFLSAMVGRSPFAIWRGLKSGGEICVHMATGTTEEQQTESTTANEGKSVSVDIFSLFTLQLLGRLELLPKLFEHVYVYSGVLEAISQEIYDFENRKSEGFGLLSHSGDALQMAQVSSQEITAELEFLRPIQAFLKSPSIELCGINPAALEKPDKREAIQVLGSVLYNPILVAAHKTASFYCDDVGLRSLANSEHALKGFCTQAILRTATAKGLITPTEYEDAIIVLLKSNYRFVSETATTLIRLLNVDNYKMSPVAQQLIRRITEPGINQHTSAQILGVAVAYVWRYASTEIETPKNVWLSECLKALLAPNNPTELFPHFALGMGDQLLTMPSLFSGISIWLLKSGLLSAVDRLVWIQSVLQWMDFYIVFSARIFPGWPSLPREWSARRDDFVRLAKLKII